MMPSCDQSASLSGEGGAAQSARSERTHLTSALAVFDGACVTFLGTPEILTSMCSYSRAAPEGTTLIEVGRFSGDLARIFVGQR